MTSSNNHTKQQAMMSTFSTISFNASAAPACTREGSLKDASEIPWLHSPTDDVVANPFDTVIADVPAAAPTETTASTKRKRVLAQARSAPPKRVAVERLTIHEPEGMSVAIVQTYCD
jgi:hypothetical protein